MPLEIEEECPRCGSTRFYRAASTLVHLGEKVKWKCTDPDCDYSFVRIDGAVDTASA